VPLVVDASVALTWCFDDEATPETRSLYDQLVTDSVAVPSIWPIELANILVASERRRRITTADTQHFIAILDELDIQIHPMPADDIFHVLLPLARTSGLTSYDAAYLELAMRSGLPLATRDRALANAARRNGVTVIRC